MGPTPDAVIIAESWENLWKADDEGKNALMASLGAAGVIPDKSLWWSGTSPDGAADIHHNCASWSMTTGFALVGDSQAIDSNWVGYAVDKCASPSVFALCMACGQVGSK